ncbi:MAG: nucleoside phosphorylase [Bacteroidia bacterium]|nr:nucleoside phosphorylase [Bacteroidia bacterium]HQV00148.1 nucleoside phosphorylase [Bacteroidia bacterium]
MQESELILNTDGSIYHLNLLPHDIADIVINVGDPDRVHVVSKFFNHIEIVKQKREFVTHTGYYNGRRMTVISTGIGTDNIDIVYNELDALVNVDLKSRKVKEQLSPLYLIRIGTSGALQADVDVDSFVFSTHGLGLDGLMNFYHYRNNAEEEKILQHFQAHYPHYNTYAQSYLFQCSPVLNQLFSDSFHKGITASCCGFYAPQGRMIRAQIARDGMVDLLSDFSFEKYRITNFEMETSAMFGLARVLGHHCASANLIVANRITKKFSKNYQASLDVMIENVLHKLATL